MLWYYSLNYYSSLSCVLYNWQSSVEPAISNFVLKLQLSIVWSSRLRWATGLQCCQIWVFVADLATFHVKLLLLKFWFGYFLATFWLLLKILLKTGLKLVLTWSLYALMKKFFPFERALRKLFQNWVGVGLLGFLKFGCFFLKLSGNTVGLSVCI